MASLQRRGNGRWAVRWRDESGRQRWRTFEVRSEAVGFLRAVERFGPDHAVEDRIGEVNITVAEYVDVWAARQLWRPSTRRQVDCYVSGHIVPRFGTQRLSAIRPADVQLLVREMADTHSAATVRVVVAHLRSMFSEAARDGLVATNPVRSVRLPRDDRPPVTIPTVDQVRSLRLAMPEHLGSLITLTATTGLRQGEALGLDWERIDIDALSVRVDRQLVHEGFGPPKTRSSFRTVPITTDTAAALIQHRDRFGVGPDGLLFRTRRGTVVGARLLSDAMQPAARAAGLPPRTGLHCLRHFYASLLIRSGCSVKVVQARLGHATAKETLDTYAHLWPDDEDRTRAALASIML